MNCVICNRFIPKGPVFAIAMYEGVPVPNAFHGEWGGQIACQECYEVHQRIQHDPLAVAEWMEQARNPVEPLNPS